MSGPFREHRRIDASCQQDSETIPFNSSHFLDDLESDMAICSIAYLSKHYRELAFTIERMPRGRKPKGYDVVVDLGRNRWMTARWKTAEEAAAA